MDRSGDFVETRDFNGGFSAVRSRGETHPPAPVRAEGAQGFNGRRRQFLTPGAIESYEEAFGVFGRPEEMGGFQ